MIEYSNGIHLPKYDIWMDSTEPRDLCFISHAHIDHLGSHSKIFASLPTIKFYESRMHPAEYIPMEYNNFKNINGVDLKILPAGHILGSAQLLLNVDNTRILYSGDFKLRSNFTAERIEVEPADILVMEATYGSPEYLFPDINIVFQELFASIKEAISNGFTPVVLAYSLGKGQEAAKALGDNGFECLLHKTIYELLPIYEESGVVFNNCDLLSSGDCFENKVLILPPYVVQSNFVNSIKHKRLFLLSGWTENNSLKDVDVSKVFQVSDHADFNELIEYVRCVCPKLIYVTHGNPAFVEHLKSLGYRASFIGGSF